MTDNPYDILGVKPDASDKDIKAAYRKLAKDLHPDLNPGDTKAEERFKAVSAAYNLLGDKDKRARFDRGEIDASGAEKPQQQYYRSYAGAGPEQHYYSNQGFADFGEESDLFADLFGRARPGGRAGGHRAFRGADQHYSLQLSFMDAALGTKRRVTMPDGASLDISVPAGVDDGQTIRLKGKGAPGLNGGPAGDAYVKLAVSPHAYFSRRARDILLDLPVTIDEAVLGGKITVPTIHGKVALGIPAGVTSGRTLRLKGKGIGTGDKAGDQLVTLKVMAPTEPDAELADFLRGWRERHAYKVRDHLEGEKP